jgi:hypothetical protein
MPAPPDPRLPPTGRRDVNRRVDHGWNSDTPEVDRQAGVVALTTQEPLPIVSFVHI